MLTLRHATAVLLAATAAALATAVPAANAAPADVAYALGGGALLSFAPAHPEAATGRAITGVTAGETLVGLDVRPQNGMLYALGVNAGADTGTLYVVGRQTGVAAPVGIANAVALTTNGVTAVDLPTGDYGFDVNPLSDRIRVTTATGLNFRLNPNTGTAVDGDNGGSIGSVTGLNPDGGLNGATASVDGAAYTNDRPNAVVTTLYGLSAAADQLTIQTPANAGTETAPKGVTLGGAPVDVTSVGGFDLDPAVIVATNNAAADGEGYAVLAIGGRTDLYKIALATGALTDLGPIGDGTTAVRGLALQRALDDGGFPVVAVPTGGATLMRFLTATPSTTSSVAVTGLAVGETLVAVAWRPQTGQLLGIGINAAADTGTLYLLDPQTGAASAIGATGNLAWVDGVGVAFDLSTAGWGMDVNPTVDRLRVVNNPLGLNARVNPVSGGPVDGDLGGSSGSVPGNNPDHQVQSLPAGATGVAAVAYTNAFTQPLTGGVTTEYALEPASNQLMIVNPPNAGTLTTGKTVTEAGAPLDFGTTAALDLPGEVAVATSAVPATGEAIAALVANATPAVYRLDLATGAATLLGAVPATVASLAVGDAQRSAPAPDGGGGPPIPGGTTTTPITTTLTPTPIKVVGDTTKPVISKLAVAAKAKRKLTITFTASEAGKATITLLRETKGRRQGSRCVAQRKRGKTCTIRKAYGSVSKTITKAGKVTVTINGKVGSKKLATGALRVEVKMKDNAGNASKVAAKAARVRR